MVRTDLGDTEALLYIWSNEGEGPEG